MSLGAWQLTSWVPTAAHVASLRYAKLPNSGAILSSITFGLLSASQLGSVQLICSASRTGQAMGVVRIGRLKAVFGVSAVILAGTLLTLLLGDFERWLVAHQLARIPGVSVARVWGNEDPFETGKVNAEVGLPGATSAMLFSLGLGSFVGSSPVRIARLGQLSPWVESYGCWGDWFDEEGRRLKLRKIGSSTSLDVSDGSFAASHLVHRFVSVTDALSHPEELAAVIRAIPRCPAHEEVTTADGMAYRYCVQECPSYEKSCTSGPGHASNWVDSAPCD
jgi:hypothetical protein